MLHLLGTPRIALQSRPTTRMPDKAYVLLSLLILKFGGIADRGTLAALLWEDKDADAARANLRNLLSQLRFWQERHQIVLLKADTSRVWRDVDCVSCDIDDLLVGGPPESDAATSARLELYTRDLLQGLRLDDDASLLAWIVHERAALKDRILDSTLATAERAGQTVGAALRKTADFDPANERIERALLAHLFRFGSPASVREEYRTFARRLRSETGTEPELETRSLARALGVGLDATARTVERPVVLNRRGLPRIMILPPVETDFVKRGARMAAMSLIDDVTFTLCKLRTFAVIAPHTARQVGLNPANAAKTGGLDYVLFTRLLPGDSDSDYRLGFSLTRTATQEVLLGDHFRFTLAELPARHADIAKVIVALVSSGIAEQELGLFRGSKSPSAYVYFLMAQERLRSIDLPQLRASRNALRHALELQPDFAPAMSMLSRTFSLEWFLRNRADDSLLSQSRELALKAIERDPLDANGFRELGNAAIYAGELDESLEYFAQARHLAPHHADVLLDSADALVHNSRHLEAKKMMEQAFSLNPLAPDEYRWVASTVHFYLHDYQTSLNLALSMANPDPLGRMIAASAHLVGNRDLSRHWRDRTMERDPSFRVENWRKLIKLRNSADQDFFEDAMRAAGFP